MSRLRISAPVWVVLIGTLIAEVLVRADNSRAPVIPAPSAVFEAMWESAERLLVEHIPITLLETLIGLALGLVIGVSVAALLDFSPPIRRALYPLLIVTQTIPIIALAPVLILVFGLGIGPKVVVVTLFSFFPIAVATTDGLTSTDPDLVALFKAIGATRAQIWRKVRLPAALPSLFSGLRIAATYGITGAIIGEYITSRAGLGRYLRDAFSSFRTDRAFAAIIIAALLSVLLVKLVDLVERRLLPWYFSEARESGWNEPGIY